MGTRSRTKVVRLGGSRFHHLNHLARPSKINPVSHSHNSAILAPYFSLPSCFCILGIFILRVLFFETRSHSAAQSGLELLAVLLPQLPEGWREQPPLALRKVFFFFNEILKVDVQGNKNGKVKKNRLNRRVSRVPQEAQVLGRQSHCRRHLRFPFSLGVTAGSGWPTGTGAGVSGPHLSGFRPGTLPPPASRMMLVSP